MVLVVEDGTVRASNWAACWSIIKSECWRTVSALLAELSGCQCCYSNQSLYNPD
jgi:hypothetical protein